jgi:hypothetical protein
VSLQASPRALAEGALEGDSLDLLGPLVPFLERGTLALVDREALIVRLDDLRGYCWPSDPLGGLGPLLGERTLLGYWTGGHGGYLRLPHYKVPL